MEEQVGMMAHNEKYKQSVEIGDELYQEDSVMPNVGSKEMVTQGVIDEPFDREAYQKLNPASTTSSLQQVERNQLEQVDVDEQNVMASDMNKSYHVASDDIRVQ